MIIGGGRVSKALGKRLEQRGEEVLIVEEDEDVIEDLRTDGFSVRHGDATDQDVLKGAGAENAEVVAAASGNDDVNLLIAKLARNILEVDRVIARVNEPGNLDIFEDLDVEAISAGMSVPWSMDNVIERPAISRWRTELGRSGDVQEVEVSTESIVGETVAELMEELPEDCHLALLNRDGTNQLPHPEDRIEHGDHLTFIGRTEAVSEAIAYCSA